MINRVRLLRLWRDCLWRAKRRRRRVVILPTYWPSFTSGKNFSRQKKSASRQKCTRFSQHGNDARTITIGSENRFFRLKKVDSANETATNRPRLKMSRFYGVPFQTFAFASPLTARACKKTDLLFSLKTAHHL